ncbi:D-alanyl-D-alanine carboxypeptidase/D-alanyl-D-alanine endopeptidase [Algicella marina]|uniref:D-alanyl-D-alanine carboxypeptidase/D-alanyl-D-alanine-endopeptidase n=1 Tax=Algicella marina TaxID=2683284 RepID=A0A6P1SXR3_9RHOB|nr:D-alanyl-D-alanine carboxypeptidase/D-alanyl-D-alanine-endopeptidase [Algicella marina]QHQ35474.1 D-alanyl-D-alanine carboxypeptidase/D-alanyl-D-alanine-endopeptidase [Algicella marina]
MNRTRMAEWNRRAVLAGLGASLPGGAMALERAGRPMLRRDGLRERTSVDVVQEGPLAAVTGFALRDLSDGRMLAAHQPLLSLPPASVAKAVTSLYALEALGSNYRFRTQVLATGAVSGGRLEGDLYLIGDGDPTLDTDGLAALAAQLKDRGIRSVAGRAFVVDSALPYQRSIDPTQPEHVGYNPAISGLNLNFNRVHFQWSRAGQGYAVQMTARGRRYDPAVASIEMAVARRNAPVFIYRGDGGRDTWSVASGALGREGSRWLPVRRPGDYAGEVFRELAHGFGIVLPAFRVAESVPAGTVLAEVESGDSSRLLRDMLKYSTNLTAEVIGLRTSQARGMAPKSVAASGAAMTGWLRERFGVHRADFLNHSGLTDRTRMTAAEMVQVLDIAAAGPLPGLLKETAVSVAPGSRERLPGVRVFAKTGTLNFTRGLAGYLEGSNGRRLAFAIFTADLAARAGAVEGEVPRGAKSWRNRALRQEMDLLRTWAQTYL